MTPRVLIAGIGNIFLSDDGFGVEVVRRLAQRGLPPNVVVIDFGIRGFDLVQALLSGYDAAILVDATSQGGPPGSVYVLEPDVAVLDPQDFSLEGHSLDPWKVLHLAKLLGGQLPRIHVVGCEPATVEENMELSEEVLEAVDPAIEMIDLLIAETASRRREGERCESERKSVTPEGVSHA